MDNAEQQERLVAMCENIKDRHAKVYGPGDVFSYEIDHRDDPTARPVAVVHTMYSHAYFSFYDAAILMNIDYEDPQVGDVLFMHIRYGSFDEDHEVADAITTQLSE